MSEEQEGPERPIPGPVPILFADCDRESRQENRFLPETSPRALSLPSNNALMFDHRILAAGCDSDIDRPIDTGRLPSQVAEYFGATR